MAESYLRNWPKESRVEVHFETVKLLYFRTNLTLTSSPFSLKGFPLNTPPLPSQPLPVSPVWSSHPLPYSFFSLRVPGVPLTGRGELLKTDPDREGDWETVFFDGLRRHRITYCFNRLVLNIEWKPILTVSRTDQPKGTVYLINKRTVYPERIIWEIKKFHLWYSLHMVHELN